MKQGLTTRSVSKKRVQKILKYTVEGLKYMAGEGGIGYQRIRFF